MHVFGIALILLFALIWKELDCVKRKKTRNLDDCYNQDGCPSHLVPPRVSSLELRPRQEFQHVEHARLNVHGEAQAPYEPNEGASTSRVNNVPQQPSRQEPNTQTPTKRSTRIAARQARIAQQGHHCGNCQTSENPHATTGSSNNTPPIISDKY